MARSVIRSVILLLAVAISFTVAPTTYAAAATTESLSAQQIPLIFPGMYYQNTPEAQYQLPKDAKRLELRTADGVKIEAVFWTALTRDNVDPSHVPTIIYFYGNAQCINYSLAQADVLRRSGANVLVGDYPGFGLSEGKPSETGCYAEATALYDWAMAQRDIDHSKLVAAGWSLGAAVAIDLAARKHCAGLITFSAFTSKRELSRTQPQFADIPPDAIEHPFLSRDKIRTITCPILIIHGRKDTLVPFSMSAELRDAAGGKPLTYLPIEEAGHNDLFLVGEKQIEAAVRQFLLQLGTAPDQRPR